MRVIFVCSPSRAYGEINSVVPLAKSVADARGEVWFLASPLAAEVAKLHFPDRVFQMTSELERNQTVFWRMVKKFDPDLIVFAELYEILRPNRRPECPFIDPEWLRKMADVECTLIFMDFITHIPMLRGIARCERCAGRFGTRALEAFLERLWVVLPCPLNEPGTVEGRCGIPYRTHALPLTIDPRDRARVRARLLGEGHQEDGFLVVRTGSSWQALLAEEYGVPLYEHLGDLLAAYLGDLPRPVTLVSISSRHRIRCNRGGLRVCNISNLPPHEFDELILSSDLVVTDNEIGYTLAKTLGSVPSLVLVNTYTCDELLERSGRLSQIRQIVLEMARRQRDSIYPHKIFPIPAGHEELVEDSPESSHGASHSTPLWTSTLRLGRMISSPFVKAELYGEEDTREVFRLLLCDPDSRAVIEDADSSFIERLQKLDDGITVLTRLAVHSSLAEHKALVRAPCQSPIR
jgi:Family of unknown function (DUF6365)